MTKLDPKSKIGGIAVEMKIESNIDEQLDKMDILLVKGEKIGKMFDEINAKALLINIGLHRVEETIEKINEAVVKL